MHLCINCNAQGVKRIGDTFKCLKCKYEWDVAHEQANVAYLASQGRKPATSVTAAATEAEGSPEAKLLKELGIDSLAGGAPDLEEKWRSSGDEDDADDETGETAPADEPTSGESDTDTPIDEGYHINVRIEGDPDGELESDVTLDVNDVLLQFEMNTVPLLKEKAEQHDVDLTGATVKADIIERLLKSGKLTAVFDADGDLVDVE